MFAEVKYSYSFNLLRYASQVFLIPQQHLSTATSCPLCFAKFTYIVKYQRDQIKTLRFKLLKTKTNQKAKKQILKDQFYDKMQPCISARQLALKTRRETDVIARK